MATCMAPVICQMPRLFGVSYVKEYPLDPMEFPVVRAPESSTIASMLFTVDKNFSLDERSYNCKRDLQYVITEQNGAYAAQNDSLGSYLGSDNFEDMITEIYTELDFIWRNYALEDDKNLTLDAIHLKNTLLSYIQEA